MSRCSCGSPYKFSGVSIFSVKSETLSLTETGGGGQDLGGLRKEGGIWNSSLGEPVVYRNLVWLSGSIKKRKSAWCSWPSI